MIGKVLFACIIAGSLAQYNYNQNQYAPQQPYRHQGQGHQQNNAAPVHYVNIGPQLQGDYKFGYNTGNDGSFREETRNPDGSVSGAYGYLGADGKQKIIKYTAGKDGFKAEGDDIPKAAPPQPAQPQQYQPAPQQYQPQPQQYQPPSVYNNYIQPQQSQGYPTYAAPQQYNSQQQQPGSYNPFAYHQPGPGQQVGNQLSQLSYSIGGGQQNHYQG